MLSDFYHMNRIIFQNTTLAEITNVGSIELDINDDTFGDNEADTDLLDDIDDVKNALLNSSLTENIEIDDLKDGFGELKENFQNLGANMTSLGSLNDTKAIELINKIDGMINKTYEVTESDEIENNDGNKNETVGIIDNADYYEGKMSGSKARKCICTLAPLQFNFQSSLF